MNNNDFVISPNVNLYDSVLEFIRLHNTSYRQRYQKLENYYKGKHDILNKTTVDGKPNNKIVEDLCKHVVEIRTGYFSGNPVTINHPDKNINDSIQDILYKNDFANVNGDLDEFTSIYGNAYAVLYINELKEVCIDVEKPYNCFIIYDNTIRKNAVAGVRYFYYTVDNKDYLSFTIYTNDKELYYEGDVNKPLLVEETPNIFGIIPIIEFVENKWKLGSFESAIPIVDAIESILSSNVNEIEYMDNCYLVLKGVYAEEEDLTDMKNNRIIIIDKDSDASFLTKDINDSYNKNTLEELTNRFHKSTSTPSVTDENFAGNISGEAMKYKLFALEKSLQTKESKWRTSLYKVLQCITSFQNIKGSNIDYTDYTLTFTRSTPQNLTEKVDLVSKLNGIVSSETLLGQLPFIDDVNYELELIRKEKEVLLDQYDFSNDNGDEDIE